MGYSCGLGALGPLGVGSSPIVGVGACYWAGGIEAPVSVPVPGTVVGAPGLGGRAADCSSTVSGTQGEPVVVLVRGLDGA